jgi:RNA polymerase sigma-70 factor, ECF subfamily
MEKEKNITELLIFRRMAMGDKEAFRFFFDKYYADLVNFVNLYLHNPLAAEDVVQDIFIWFWDKRNKIEIETSVKAYLIRASKNKSLNYLRGERRKLHFQEKLNQQDAAPELPDDFLDAVQIRLLMQQAFDKLPGRVREIFLMGKERKMTYAQIAQELGIAEKTVENQMGIALKKIREQLRPFYDKLFALFLLEFFV